MEVFSNTLTEKRKAFGEILEITTSHSLHVALSALGASIQKIAVKNQTGEETPLVLGFEDPIYYQKLCCYAGATLGPNAGRIRGGRLPDCQLACNDGANQLHGGLPNLSAKLWDIHSVSSGHDAAVISMRTEQPDGLCGYPGNRRYEVCYTIEDTNWITIEYTAYTDRPTYINLSNHTYWNLSGHFEKSACHQKLRIFSNNVCQNDTEHLPADIIPVQGTVFDFRKSRTMKNAKNFRQNSQLQMAHGYNHAFLLNKNQAGRNLRGISRVPQLKPACILTDPASGRTLRIFTDAEALVVYSGGFLEAGMPLLCGQRSVPSCAVALEAQDIPDVMHLLPEYYRLTTPEAPFHRTIRFQLII